MYGRKHLDDIESKFFMQIVDTFKNVVRVNYFNAFDIGYYLIKA